MTTKEFVRRSTEFKSLDLPAVHFKESSDSIFKCTELFMGIKHVFYVREGHDFRFVDIDLLMVERYSFSQFSIDLKYFKSFLARCSEYQTSVLRADPELVHLFALLNEGSE